MSGRKWMIRLSLISVTALSTIACAARVAYVHTAPPAKRVEVRPAKPFANAVWIGGHWRWSGRNYVWVGGKWVRPAKGKHWVAGHWRRTARGYRWVPGHWR